MVSDQPAATGAGAADAVNGDDVVVDTHALTKIYGRTVAVADLDLQIRRGEVYGFVGPNGAGKTTTLRMLLGLVRPTRGRVTVAGRRPGDPVGIATVGAMIEAPGFYPYLSGRENLLVMARHAGTGGDRIDDVLTRVALADRAENRFATYSSGMKQRLGLAAAMLKDPAVLILDEPTSGLDPEGMKEMRQLLRKLGRGKRAVLLSSHLMTEVEQICDRVGVITRGRLVAEGSVDELRGVPELRVRAKPLDGARELIGRMPDVGEVRSTDGVLVVEIEPRRSGEVNRRLMDAGVEVTELTPSQPSLEKVFLDMVRHGGQRDDDETDELWVEERTLR